MFDTGGLEIRIEVERSSRRLRCIGSDRVVPGFAKLLT